MAETLSTAGYQQGQRGVAANETVLMWLQRGDVRRVASWCRIGSEKVKV
jgi:hypothetical protein